MDHTGNAVEYYCIDELPSKYPNNRKTKRYIIPVTHVKYLVVHLAQISLTRNYFVCGVFLDTKVFSSTRTMKIYFLLVSSSA